MKSLNFFFFLLFLVFNFSFTILAGAYDIKEMTPQIQKAFDGRQSRYNQLQDLKASGVLGEDNQGLVKVLKPFPEADAMMRAENSDRQVIYSAIANQNGLGPAGLSQIKRIFAEVQREKARNGDHVQLPTGDWVEKNCL